MAASSTYRLKASALRRRSCNCAEATLTLCRISSMVSSCRQAGDDLRIRLPLCSGRERGFCLSGVGDPGQRANDAPLMLFYRRPSNRNRFHANPSALALLEVLSTPEQRHPNVPKTPRRKLNAPSQSHLRRPVQTEAKKNAMTKRIDVSSSRNVEIC